MIFLLLKTISQNEVHEDITFNNACMKTQVLDRETAFSRLAKSENPQFNCVSGRFSDKRNEENGVFLPAQNKKQVKI